MLVTALLCVRNAAPFRVTPHGALGSLPSLKRLAVRTAKSSSAPTPPPNQTKTAKAAGKAAPNAPLPKDFHATWELIKELRADRTAVVDTMGCGALHDLCPEGPEVAVFQTLVSLMLSSQTRDTVNFEVMGRLRARGLTVPSILALPEEDLRALIKPVSFFKTKAKHIKATAKILADEHGGTVPATLEQLLALPGVGPKMAILQLQVRGVSRKKGGDSLPVARVALPII